MSQNDDMLDQAIRQARQAAPPAYPHEEVAQRFAETPGPQSGHNLSQRVSRHPIRLAIAALASVAACVLLWHGALLGERNAYAVEQIGDAVQQARTLQFKATTLGWQGDPWPDPLVRNSISVSPWRTRTDNVTTGQIQILDLQAGTFTWIEPKQRKVTIRPTYQSDAGGPTLVDEFSQQLRSAAGRATEKTKSTLDDGREVVQFDWRFQGVQHHVTADATTMLPLRLEVDHGPSPDGKHIREIYNDFVFDAPLDDARFEFDIPDDYEVEHWRPDPKNTSYPNKDAQELIVSHGRIGPASDGMSEQEIVAVLGEPDWRKETTHTLPKPRPRKAGEPAPPVMTSVQLEYASRGFRLSLDSAGSLGSVSCTSQAMSGPLVRDFAGRTAEGVKVGDSRQSVIDTYGEPDIVKPDYLNYVHLGWAFHLREGAVVGFHASAPRPPVREDGVQTRILEDGTVLTTAPGVDIDAAIEELRQRREAQRAGQPEAQQKTQGAGSL